MGRGELDGETRALQVLKAVAGVELHIEEYRVLDNDTFAQIQDTLHRFEGRGHKRPQMQVDRKQAKIDKIFGQYFAQLEEG